MKRFALEDKVLDFLRQNSFLLSAIVVTFFAVLIRMAGFNIISSDYTIHINPWLNYLKEHGNILGIATISSDYTPPSLLLYSLLSYFPETWILWSIKISSSIFDFLLAVFSYKIILNLTGSRIKSLLAYSLILFCPTIFLNSAFWGQCDGIFTSFLIISLYFVFKDSMKMSLFFYGLALSFKLQAIFILPFFVFIYAYKKWNITEVFFSVIGFFTLNVPLWFFGIPILKWAKVYLYQMHLYNQLTLNAPTIYAIFPGNDRIGIIFLLVILITLTFFILHSKKECNKEIIVLLFLMCSSFIPYILPRMHERYFYIADVLSILYAVYNPKKWLIPIIIIFPSLITYGNYLWHVSMFPLSVLSIIMGIGVVYISKELIQKIK